MNHQNAGEGHREFYLPIRRRLPQKIPFHCRHCGTSYPAEYAMDWCWPDRRYGSNRGLVVVCKSCGCRQSLEHTTKKTNGSSREGTGGKNEPGINWIPALILAILAIVTAAAVLLILVGRDSRPDSDSRNRNWSDVASSGVAEIESEHNSVAGADVGADGAEQVIQPAQMGDIGNLFINISEGGLMQIVEDRVYYTNPRDDYRIYSMDFAFQE